MSRRRRGVATILVALLALAACDATGGSATVPVAPSGPPGAVTPAPVPTPTRAPAVTVTPVPVPTGDASPPGVRLDESLLGMLPSDIDGVPVAPEAQSFTDAAADPAFAANVEAAAFFVVVDGGDLASGGLARLRPGVFSEAFFRDWRDSYNEGACGQAGGVVGNAEAELGGRTVFITSCAGDLRVYHAYVQQQGVIVSLFSLGERRLGEQVMGALRP